LIENSTSKIIEEIRLCKIVVGGEGAVGKTTLCHRLTGQLKKEEERLMTYDIELQTCACKVKLVILADGYQLKLDDMIMLV
jgi:GTPase SAR1 family protein